jgi:hypothetical protein
MRTASGRQLSSLIRVNRGESRLIATKFTDRGARKMLLRSVPVGGNSAVYKLV